MSPARRAGFTLIEVLVALAIAALGLASVLSVVTNSARNSVYLRDKIFASWIAQNRNTELRLGTTMPSVDQTSGDLDYAGRKWKWEQTVTQTEVPGMRRLDIAVRLAEAPAENVLANATGFIGRTQLTAPPSATTWELNVAGGAAAGQPGAVPGPPPGLSPSPGLQPPATGGTTR